MISLTWASIGFCAGSAGAPGRIRTCDTRFRRAVLYPLSYGGGETALRMTWRKAPGEIASGLGKGLGCR